MQSTNPNAERTIYPKSKVIFGFGLTGGAIGGFFVALANIFLRLVDYANDQRLFYEFLEMIVFSLTILPLFGILVGGIPAFLTGVYLTYIRFNLNLDKKTHYVQLFLIGTIITFVVYTIFIVSTGYFSIRLKDIVDNLQFSIVGGLSSVVCGFLFLPKIRH